VHGINDTNVTTSQFALWWNALAAHHVPRKIWLSQMSHVDPFDIRRGVWVDTLHRWFDRYLQDLPNGIDREPQASLETGPGTWVDQPTWPAARAHPVRVELIDAPVSRAPATEMAERQYAARAIRQTREREVRLLRMIVVKPDKVAEGNRKFHFLISIERIESDGIFEAGNDQRKTERIKARLQQLQVI